MTGHSKDTSELFAHIPSFTHEMQRTLAMLNNSTALQLSKANSLYVASLQNQFADILPKLNLAAQFAIPTAQLVSHLNLGYQASFAKMLSPIVDQMLSQRTLFDSLGSTYSLALRVDQAGRAWRLANRPRIESGASLAPASIIADVGNAAISINSAAAATAESDDLDLEVETWQTARSSATDHIIERLGQIDPKLAVKFKGMWHVIGSGGPDCVSQAANSAIELLDHTLRALSPEKEVLVWREQQGKYADEMNPENQRPHRSLRIRYIAAW